MSLESPIADPLTGFILGKCHKKPHSILKGGLETNRLELKYEQNTAIKVQIIPSPP